MRTTMSLCVVPVVLAAVGCTNDFGQFTFEGAGGSGGATTSAQGGSGPTTSSMTTTSNTTTSSTTTTTSSTTTSTTSTTTSTTATTSTTSGGQETIPCGGETCDVPQEVCCNDGTSTDGCNADPVNCANQHLDCNDDADCGGMKCCAEKSGPDYINTRCKSVCGGSDAHVCDTGTQISTLPTGYDFCP